MSITLSHDYVEGLRAAKPTFLSGEIVKTPGGSLSAPRIIRPQKIPPVNTDIDFSMLPQFTLESHPGLSALTTKILPITFNWKNGTKNEKTGKFNQQPAEIIDNLTPPGNQMLCGSCWAISAAGIVNDNFVISKITPYNPTLSTTYSLACYPQAQCKGGNPAKLLQDIASHGIVSKHCIDYSWCSQNSECNGTALHHFRAGTNLSSLIPSCGCYEKEEFLEYKIDTNPGPSRIAINSSDLNAEKFVRTVKAHIFHNGPLLGSFIVFKNFMRGTFTKTHENKGIYLEKATYSNGKASFRDKISILKDYVGSHAVAIIGWGLELDVQINEKGEKQNVPYWFCRNSWKNSWGDNGYFKMAMYPVNRLSQFDKLITINSPKGKVLGGGMVIFKTSEKPKLVSFKKIKNNMQGKRFQPDSFYEKDSKKIIKSMDKDQEKNRDSKIGLVVGLVIGSIILIILLISIWYYFIKRKNSLAISFTGRQASLATPIYYY